MFTLFMSDLKCVLLTFKVIKFELKGDAKSARLCFAARQIVLASSRRAVGWLVELAAYLSPQKTAKGYCGAARKREAREREARVRRNNKLRRPN